MRKSSHKTAEERELAKLRAGLAKTRRDNPVGPLRVLRDPADDLPLQVANEVFRKAARRKLN